MKKNKKKIPFVIHYISKKNLKKSAISVHLLSNPSESLNSPFSQKKRFYSLTKIFKGEISYFFFISRVKPDGWLKPTLYATCETVILFVSSSFFAKSAFMSKMY